MTHLDSAADIDRSVDRLLRRAGARYRFPTPVDDIAAAQRLQVATPAASPLAPGVIATAPAALQEAMRAVRYKVLAVLDRRGRHVHLDPDSLEVQRRFSACHEVGHDICQWHVAPFYADGSEQLAPDVRATFEREANYAATRLLFQQGVFAEVAGSLPVGAGAVLHLATQFGASIHATFWHYVETSRQMLAGFILSPTPVGAETAAYRFRIRTTLVSPSFAQAFPVLESVPTLISTQDLPDLKVAWEALFASDLPSTGEMNLMGRDGNTYLLTFELFSNYYNVFLIAYNPRVQTPKQDKRLWTPRGSAREWHLRDQDQV